MLGSLILYLKGMRRMMFQLSGFYCNFQPPESVKPLNPKSLKPETLKRGSSRLFAFKQQPFRFCAFTMRTTSALRGNSDHRCTS